MHQIHLQERLRGAIWGEFIGDAALCGKIDNLKQSDNFKYYSDAALLLLHSLIYKHGFSARDFGTRFVEKFASPDYTCPVGRTTHETIENYHLSLEEGHPDLGYEFQGGANTTDVDSATRLAPLVALYWDDPKLFYVLDKATRVTQNNELTVAYMRSYARILCNLFQGQDLLQVLRNETKSAVNDTPLDTHVRDKIKKALELEKLNILDATAQFGKGSHLDQSYPSAIHAAVKGINSFKEALTETVRAGGDCAGRAAIAGAWLGAFHGIAGIPAEWPHSLKLYTSIDKDIETLLNLKTSSHL